MTRPFGLVGGIHDRMERLADPLPNWLALAVEAVNEFGGPIPDTRRLDYRALLQYAEDVFDYHSSPSPWGVTLGPVADD